MPGKAVGRAAVDLPWLCPNTDSLIGLAEEPAGLARQSAADPALLAFLVRFATAAPTPSVTVFPTERLLSPTLPETAAACLRFTPAGWVDPAARIVEKANQVAALAAGFARQFAERIRGVSPAAAEAAARLAPLGWYAVAAVEPSDALGCLRDPGFRADPAAAQRCWWGLGHDAIARRLATRWRFPAWLADILGHLGLPLSAARVVVRDPDLFAVVQLALREAQSRSFEFGLGVPADREALLAHLGLTSGAVGDASPPAALPPASGYDPNPHNVSLVGNLLRLAAEARRRTGAALAVRLEERIDDLHRAAADLAALAGDRLRDAKLAGLAEFAAGAGHEINNPLAVIAGHAQRLLRTEADTDRADSLRAVLRQTQRISTLLRDLMHFARPARPEPQRLAVADVMTAVRDELAPVAAERRVRLELANLPAGVWLRGDPRQVRHALTAVVRNGIEAAGVEGWVRLGCEWSETAVRFVIEDGGPGLTPEAAEHAFDPFFCGRSAGRGRGLGLATAWQFARQNGGEVRFAPEPNGPTRFVLSFPPTGDEVAYTERRSA